MRFSGTLIFTIAFLVFCQIRLKSQTLEQQLNSFDEYVEQSRQKFQVPGCAVAIVHKGEVVFTKGYGHLSVKGEKPVNAQSLFGIMSTTKAMTAAAMALLVDEGKLAWDDQVIDYLPDFRLQDAYVTRDLRIRDLFTHNAGLGNTDFLWAFDEKANQDFILHQMRLAKPAYPLRGGYTYQNIMYLAAGKVIEKVSGMTWERFMKERIYTPLEMNNTYPNMAYSMQYQNRSIAHQRLDGEIITIPEMSGDPIAPAGATWSTIEDMAKWTQFMLKPSSDEALIKTENKDELTKPQIIIPQNQFYPTVSLTKPHWTTYGLGWFQQDYRGSMLNFHTGSLDGRTAIVALLKDHEFGFYFFGNLDHAELRHALMLRAIDEFVFQDTNRDWSEEVFSLYANLRKSGERSQAAMMGKRIEGTQPSKELKAYTGRFSHPFYGEAKLSWQEDALHFEMGSGQSGTLEHWHYDTFLIHFDNAWWSPQAIQFLLDPVSGEVSMAKAGGMELKKE
jgi:CubicO group peptidase (beta-lactamase class C family)